MKNFKALLSAGLMGAAVMVSGSATAAEPIVGNWKTQTGGNASIKPCGGAYCITVVGGKYAGKRIGRLSGKGGTYSGTITDPADGKKYSGSAKVKGKGMKLRGCALKVFCKTQNWKKR